MLPKWVTRNLNSLSLIYFLIIPSEEFTWLRHWYLLKQLWFETYHSQGIIAGIRISVRFLMANNWHCWLFTLLCQYTLKCIFKDSLQTGLQVFQENLQRKYLSRTECWPIVWKYFLIVIYVCKQEMFIIIIIDHGCFQQRSCWFLACNSAILESLVDGAFLEKASHCGKSLGISFPGIFCLQYDEASPLPHG